MGIESSIHYVLNSVFGGALYPVIHPDPDGNKSSVESLYAIYFKVGGRSFNKLDGDSDLSRPRIQISIYGIDFDDVVAKEDAVNLAMKTANDLASQIINAGGDPFSVNGSIVNVSVSVPIHGYEPDTKRFVSRMEFYCWDRS